MTDELIEAMAVLKKSQLAMELVQDDTGDIGELNNAAIHVVKCFEKFNSLSTKPTLDAEEFCQEVAFETMKAIFGKLNFPPTCWRVVESSLAALCKTYAGRLLPHLHLSESDRQLREKNERLREIIDEFPELNMSNYGEEEVSALNQWGIRLVKAVSAPPTEAEKGSES